MFYSNTLNIVIGLNTILGKLSDKTRIYHKLNFAQVPLIWEKININIYTVYIQREREPKTTKKKDKIKN